MSQAYWFGNSLSQTETVNNAEKGGTTIWTQHSIRVPGMNLKAKCFSRPIKSLEIAGQRYRKSFPEEPTIK